MRNTQSDGLAFFTLASFALALGRTKRAVRLALEGISPAGSVDVRGQLAHGWSLLQFPERLRLDLRKVAVSRGYRNEGHLLQEPPQRWKSSIPLSEVADHHLTHATRLRGALRRALRAQDDASWEKGLCGECYREFQKEFGSVSERHFRRLIKRTIERDAGEENFDDLSIYLDEKLTAKARGSIPAQASPEDQLILECLAGIKKPTAPTMTESDRIWVVACESIHLRIELGENEKQARKQVASLLSEQGVNLSDNADALKKQVKRKYRNWLEKGQTINAVADQRRDKSGHYRTPKLGADDHNMLVALAARKFGGRIAPAWKLAADYGLVGEEITQHYVGNPSRKSYVPQSIRAQVRTDVKCLKNIHHGPREHRLKGAHHTRDWSGVAAGDWMSSDDCTPPVYFYNETANGVELMRGQFLPMTDVRTSFILGFVLILERNYNSLHIRSLITRCCTDFGLPRKGFVFERGIWKSSRILTGKKGVDTWEFADRGLRSLGLQISHAQLPRGKTIENVLGRLQNQMEDLPGYAGRSEQTEKFERMQKNKLAVETGREPADKYFLSEKEIYAQYRRVCEEFNDTPQEGRMLGGLSPQQGWDSLQSTPRTLLDESCVHLLAHDCRKLKVGANGVTFPIGKKPFNYKSLEAGKRIGQEVLAWFNSERPELLTCTDLNQENPFTLERHYDLPAMAANREQLAAGNTLIAAQNSHAKELYYVTRNTLGPEHYRANIVDRKTERLGQAIVGQRKAITAHNQKKEKRRVSIDRLAERIGVPRSHLGDSQAAEDFLTQLAEMETEDN